MASVWPGRREHRVSAVAARRGFRAPIERAVVTDVQIESLVFCPTLRINNKSARDPLNGVSAAP